MIIYPVPGYLRSELESLALASHQLAQDAETIVNDLERDGKSLILRLGEVIKGPVVRRQLQAYDKFIKANARDDFQIRMMRAIVFEEQSHEAPPFLEGVLERMGFGDSIGPSQIRESLWAKKYKTNREKLIDPKTHFRAMRQLLDDVERKAVENRMARTPENIGSLWNNMSARAPTDYGRRVKEFDEMLEKERSAGEFAEKLAASQLEAERQQKSLREREVREIEAREAERKKQQEQRNIQDNYGPSQRSFLSSGQKRNHDCPTANRDRFENPLTRPTPLYLTPLPAPGPLPQPQPAPLPAPGLLPQPQPAPLPAPGPLPQPAPLPVPGTRPQPAPAPAPSPVPKPAKPKSKEDLPIQRGGPLRLP